MSAPSGRRVGRFVEPMILAALILLILIFSVLPLTRLVMEGIAPQGRLTTAPLLRVLGNARTWTAAEHSVVTALGGVCLATLAGSTLAMIIATTDVRGRNAFVFCFVLPLIIPPQVMALSWLQISGPASPLLEMLHVAPPIGTPNPLASPGGIMMLFGIQYAPLVFLSVRAGLRSFPRELIEAGLSSRARPAHVIRTIVLPLATPSLIAGAALCFVSCIGNFGIPAFLGTQAGYVVLTTLIYQDLSGLGPQVLGDVAILSILIGAMAIVVLFAHDFFIQRRDYRSMNNSGPVVPFKLGRLRPVVEISLALLATLFVIVPIVGLLLASLAPAYGVPVTAESATLSGYIHVLSQNSASRRAFLNSFFLAGASAILIAVVALPFAYLARSKNFRFYKLLDFAATLPYAAPGVVLAIATILLFLRPLPLLGVSICNTIWIILFAYLARFFILGLRPIVSMLFQLDPSLEEAAQVEGASLLRRLFTIVLPLVAPAVGAGVLLIFLTAFSELTVSALLWSVGSETLGVIVFGFEQGGDANFAAAVGVLTLAFIIGLMLLTLPFAGRLPPGVLPWRD